MRVALSGATGFIGTVLRQRWCGPEFQLQALPRVDLAAPFDLTACLKGAEVLVHAAARAHVLREPHPEPLARFRAVNVQGSIALARQAIAAGVRRVVFVSSIGVLGQSTTGRPPFNPGDLPDPQEPYAVSKWEAELALAPLTAEAGVELVIVRPPLVCGPGAKGNLLRLLRLVDRGWPLPLADLSGRRSLVGLESLADLLRLCVLHPDAPGDPLLAADRTSLTLPEILQCLADGLDRPLRLWRVPPVWLGRAAAWAGKRGIWERLSGSLEVCPAATCQRLGWQPDADPCAALRRMARSYRQESPTR